MTGVNRCRTFPSIRTLAYTHGAVAGQSCLRETSTNERHSLTETAPAEEDQWRPRMMFPSILNRLKNGKHGNQGH